MYDFYQVMFKALFSLILLYSIWVLGQTGIDLYTYFKIDREGICELLSWENVELSESDFVLKGTYAFEVQGERVKNQENILSTHYPNRFAAKKAAEEKKLGKTKVWFQANHPENSTLEHLFPYKKCFYSLLLITILFFLGWKRKVIVQAK